MWVLQQDKQNTKENTPKNSKRLKVTIRLSTESATAERASVGDKLVDCRWQKQRADWESNREIGKLISDQSDNCALVRFTQFARTGQQNKAAETISRKSSNHWSRLYWAGGFDWTRKLLRNERITSVLESNGYSKNCEKATMAIEFVWSQ